MGRKPVVSEALRAHMRSLTIANFAAGGIAIAGAGSWMLLLTHTEVGDAHWLLVPFGLATGVVTRAAGRRTGLSFALSSVFWNLCGVPLGKLGLWGMALLSEGQVAGAEQVTLASVWPPAHLAELAISCVTAAVPCLLRRAGAAPRSTARQT